MHTSAIYWQTMHNWSLSLKCSDYRMCRGDWGNYGPLFKVFLFGSQIINYRCEIILPCSKDTFKLSIPQKRKVEQTKFKTLIKDNELCSRGHIYPVGWGIYGPIHYLIINDHINSLFMIQTTIINIQYQCSYSREPTNFEKSYICDITYCLCN